MTFATPTPTDHDDLIQADARPTISNRLMALGFFTPCATVLGLAAYLRPDSAGLGTHTQLGLPPCGFKLATGVPCATCGCTTSFSHAANGSLLDAYITQPFGATLALLTAMTVIITGYALVTNMPLAPIGRIVFRPRTVVTLLILMVVSWGYSIYMHTSG
ncbi:MAG: DUF2752 domain-containing protein [Planctomycetota bacterium]